MLLFFKGNDSVHKIRSGAVAKSVEVDPSMYLIGLKMR